MVVDVGPGPVDGVVRVGVNVGGWTLDPRADGGTDFVYWNYVELGGSLWTMLGNRAARDSAWGFATNLEQECRNHPPTAGHAP